MFKFVSGFSVVPPRLVGLPLIQICTSYIFLWMLILLPLIQTPVDCISLNVFFLKIHAKCVSDSQQGVKKAKSSVRLYGCVLQRICWKRKMRLLHRVETRVIDRIFKDVSDGGW